MLILEFDGVIVKVCRDWRVLVVFWINIGFNFSICVNFILVGGGLNLIFVLRINFLRIFKFFFLIILIWIGVWYSL